ncbi:leucine-rich repeat-containing protein [Canna indica]|uniref:Leucine-rich repeat-containing protein n=1 Tax=Canna indica TaxID=4628 RepID=A0AAQ3QKF4_9LILI|nr:leucine-rich repeat-containing protein [Canna indica]
MTADANEFNVGPGVEIEREMGLGLGSEGDRKVTGDPNGIACLVGEEKVGDRSGMSATLENGNLEDSRGKDLDLEGDVDPVAVGNQESSEVKGENGQLTFENGVDHDARDDPVIEVEATVADDSNETTAGQLTFENGVDHDARDDPVIEVAATVADDSNETTEGQLTFENGVDHDACDDPMIEVAATVTDDSNETTASADVEEIIESDLRQTEGHDEEQNEILTEKEKHTKGGVCKENGETCKEEVIAELGSSNGHRHVEDSLEASKLKNETETDLVIKVGAKQFGEILVMDTNSEKELESAVEVEKNLDAPVAATDELVNVESSVYDDENQEPKSKNIETSQQEVSESSVAEDKEETVLNDTHHPLEVETPERVNQDHEIIFSATETDSQTDKDAPVVMETEEVVSETQVTESKDQGQLGSAIEVKLVEEAQTAAKDCVDKDEFEREQKVDKFVVESLPTEYSAEQETGLSNGSPSSTDKCSDEKSRVPVTGTRTTSQTVDGTESSASHKILTTSDIDAMINESESSGNSFEAGDAVIIEHSDKVHTTEGSSSSGSGVDKESLAEVPVSSQVLTDSCVQSACSEEASSTELDGVVSSKVDLPSPVDTINDIQDKLCSDVAENANCVAKAPTDAVVDDAVVIKYESRVEKESTESNTSLVNLAVAIKSLDADENKAVDGESRVIEEIQAPVKEPSASSLDSETVDTPSGKPQACYIIRIPRFVDDQLSTNIQIAQSEVNEKTQKRDSIKISIEKQKMTCNEFWKKFEAARAEERAARAAVTAKRQQMDALQLMINKIKSVHSIEELDAKIQSMEFELQHVTMPLKEEKKYIHELKQLRHQRDEFTSNMGSKTEIDEAFDQKEQIDEKFKILKKELEALRTEVLRTESIANAARKKYDEEQQNLRGLQQQFRDADALRQKAYGHWRELRSLLIEKNKHFGMYKSDQKSAENYMSSRDFEGLLLHCSKQVEKVMAMWNNDEEFRMQYVKSNMNSTLKRLRTADGRSLGPDEEPPVLPTNQFRVSSTPLQQTKIGEQVPHVTLDAKVETPKELDSFPALPATTKKQPVKPKKTSKPVSNDTTEIVVTSVSDKEIENHENLRLQTKEEEELIKVAEELAKKEEELAKKEEELRKQKAEVELKEQQRLEQRAKAKEAEERKKKQAEKAQARAEYRAQKEAELKEKRKAKKQKKKGVAAEETTVSGVEEEPVPSTESTQLETAHELDVRATSASKRPSRSVVVPKQYNKVQPIPLPLRKRGKRKMATWMWVLLAVVVVLLLFVAGNYFPFLSFGFQHYGF